MCVIQRYFVIYPDGHREPRQRLYWCPRGTPSCPCNQTETVDLFEDEIAVPPEAPPAPRPRYQIIEPRAVRRQPQPEPVRYRKKTSDGLRAVWDIHIPFTSWNKKSKPQERKIVVRERREQNPRTDRLPPIIHPPPPPPPPPPLPPIREPPIMLGPFPRPAVGQNELAEERERRRRAERIAREEHEARICAQKEADKVRRQRDREKKRNSDLERKKTRLEQERRECAASAERVRRRNAEERALAEARERARRAVEAGQRQEEEQIARAEIREQARLWAVEAVRRRVLLERAWRQEAEEEARLEEERERNARRAQQMIPREPRHLPIVHQFGQGNFEARGDRVIDDAIINAEERRQAERPAGWFRRRSVVGGHRRRDQVAVGERRIFEDDLRRVGRRFF